MCGYTGVFWPFGLYYVRPVPICSNCGSKERHRLLKFWFDSEIDQFRNSRTLYFAPEPSVTGFVKDAVLEYVTADLMRPDVDHNWNIENMGTMDADFDLIVCSHVLEHVDTRKALQKLRRCLKPVGALTDCRVRSGPQRGCQKFDRPALGSGLVASV